MSEQNSLIVDGAITAANITPGVISASNIQPAVLTGVNTTLNGTNKEVAESDEEPFVPVAERSIEDQAAYWRNEAKKQTKINRERQDYDELKAKADRLAALEQERLTDHEKALAQARDEAAREARIESLPALISAELRARHVPAEVAQAQIELLDLTKFVTDTGELHAERLDAVAKPIVVPTHSPSADYGRIGGSARGAGESLSALAAKRAAELTTKK